MPPQVTFTTHVLALLASLQVELGLLDNAGQFEVVMLCEQRLADKRNTLSTHEVMDLLGCKATKVGELRRTGLLPSLKTGASVQAARRYNRDGVLFYQLVCVVRAHRIAPLAAE
jgi:hypothetical protein